MFTVDVKQQQQQSNATNNLQKEMKICYGQLSGQINCLKLISFDSVITVFKCRCNLSFLKIPDITASLYPINVTLTKTDRQVVTDTGDKYC